MRPVLFIILLLLVVGLVIASSSNEEIKCEIKPDGDNTCSSNDSNSSSNNRNSNNKDESNKNLPQSESADNNATIKTIPGMISVIVPTTQSRSAFHESIYNCFRLQTYELKELLFLDESPQPSKYLAQIASDDERVQYIWRGDPISLGFKRNDLVESSQGEYIAHFDDDDFYGPEYLKTMMGFILNSSKSRGVELVKLSGFFVYMVNAGMLGYWDQNVDTGLIPLGKRTTAEDGSSLHFSRFFGLHIKPVAYPPQPWDFGFTMTYSRRLFNQLGGFANINIGEDSEFAKRATEQFPDKCKAAIDEDGVCMKIMHSKTSSNLAVQYVMPKWFASKLLGNHVQEYIDRADLDMNRQIAAAMAAAAAAGGQTN